MWRRRCFHGINAMILMPQIFDVTANENARYKRNELELNVHTYDVTDQERLPAIRDRDSGQQDTNSWDAVSILLTTVSFPDGRIL